MRGKKDATGGRSGVAIRVQGDIVRRLNDIRAVWLAVYNDPAHTQKEIGADFVDIVGELLEGKTFDQIEWSKYHTISEERVRQHAKEI